MVTTRGLIPVSIITGFLGAGKSTLLQRLLRGPELARTAVIINEFGEIGIDHDLIASSNETFLTLTTGCLCCAVRGDLIETLLDLIRTAAGAYDRVLIETSGLADPAPILQALMTDKAVREFHVIDTMVTVVDAVHGERTLNQFPEARRQVALADALVFTKTDLTPVDPVLKRHLDALNPGTPRWKARDVSGKDLFAGADAMTRAARLAAAVDPWRAQHTADIETRSFHRTRPLPALALTLWLQALTEHCGERLIRMKGLVAIEEMPGQPAIVHGVQHVFSPPEFLPAWPSANTDTRLVFIFRTIPRHFPARLLDAIEEEVREELETAAESR